MASPEWVEIFESYSPEELAAQITKLKDQVSVYSQQAIGNKSYTKDLAELRGQLAAAGRVQKARTLKGDHSRGVSDFSCT